MAPRHVSSMSCTSTASVTCRPTVWAVGGDGGEEQSRCRCGEIVRTVKGRRWETRCKLPMEFVGSMA